MYFYPVVLFHDFDLEKWEGYFLVGIQSRCNAGHERNVRFLHEICSGLFSTVYRNWNRDDLCRVQEVEVFDSGVVCDAADFVGLAVCIF